MQRPLMPSFLKKFDKNLLLNKPETWSTRTHLVLYYGFTFMIALTALAFIMPDNPKSDSPMFYWIGLVSIISIIALVFWMIFLLRFNVFKRYGNIKQTGRLKVFVLYFISIGTIVLFSYVEPLVESIRANNLYGDEEIVNDINSINCKIVELEHDSLKNEWRVDTFRVRNTGQYSEYDTEERAVDGVVTNYIKPIQFRVIDTSELRKKLNASDSTIKMNDSTYAFFQCPEYIFLTSYSIPKEVEENLLNKFDVFNKIVKNYKKPDVSKTKNELNNLINKYYYEHQGYHYSYEYGGTNDRNQSIRSRYKISDISRSINNITSRKYRWHVTNLPLIFRSFYYFTLCLTLLVFLFRHSTIKTFFLSALTAVILIILTSLILAFWGNKDWAFLGWLIFYSLLFLGIALYSFKSKIRTATSGIAINLFVLMINFIPLIIVELYYSIHRIQYDYLRYSKHEHNYEIEKLCYITAEISGLVLLIILLLTIIPKLYRRWYSLPIE